MPPPGGFLKRKEGKQVPHKKRNGVLPGEKGVCNSLPKKKREKGPWRWGGKGDNGPCALRDRCSICEEGRGRT